MRPSKTISAMKASVVAAGDAQIEQIVALVDAMPQRGAADGLVAPLRPRLAKLRPPRRIGFVRLLFTPLDPLIVPASTWRRGGLAIPRTALPPIGAALMALMPAEAALVETEGRRTAMTPSRMMEFAAAIWPRAAAALLTASVPPGWTDATGLPDSDYPPLAAEIAAALAVATDIRALILQREVVPEDAMRTILGRTAPRGQVALGSVVAVLLAQLPGSGRILSLATEAAGSNPARAVDMAVEHALDTLEDLINADSAIGGTMAQATQDAARVAGLLLEIEASATIRPDRRRRIDSLRRGADMLCRSRFETALNDEFLSKLSALPPNPDDAAVDALETDARGLRRLEANGRQLGGGDRYDALLRACLAPFQDSNTSLPLEDRVRLVEILLGADRAISLFE
jgi:hypothetical protein